APDTPRALRGCSAPAPGGRSLLRSRRTSKGDGCLHTSMRETAVPAPRFSEDDKEKRASRVHAEAELPAQPGPGIDPLSVRAAGTQAQHRGRLVAGQPAEVT